MKKHEIIKFQQFFSIKQLILQTRDHPGKFIKMKKPPRISVPNMLKMRHKPQPKPLLNFPKHSLSFQQNVLDLLPQIIQKIQNNQDLTTSDFNTIINIMSYKYHCSYRKSLLLDSISVVKHKYGCIQVIDRISSVKYNKNYFVLKGNLYIYALPSTVIKSSRKGKQENKIKMNGQLEKGNLQYSQFNRNNLDQNISLKQSNQRQNNLRQTNIRETNIRETAYQKYDTVFDSIESLKKQYGELTLIDKIEQLRGFGTVFKDNQSYKNAIIVIEDAVVVRIKNIQQSLFTNSGGMEQQSKLQIIQMFSIFNCLRKRISSFLQHFQLKKYIHNEIIYKQNDEANSFYLTVEGQVSFSSKMNKKSVSTKHIVKHRNGIIIGVNEGDPKKSSANSISSPKSNLNEIHIETQTISTGSYFGEQEIIYNTHRNLTAKCGSSCCFLLQINRDKFNKLLEYSDFYQMIKKSADLKILNRRSSLTVSNNIHHEFNSHQQRSPKDQKNHHYTEAEKQIAFINASDRFNTQNPNSTKIKIKISNVKVMHGSLVNPNPPTDDNYLNYDVQFSMLKANQQMYDSTIKKFRKYTIKPQPKIKPQVNWNFKRVWKVLNLENILKDQVQLTSPEGRRYYQSHQRYKNHINQVKSLRPKTSSTSYRTKLQYIAYLQQFNNKSQHINAID